MFYSTAVHTVLATACVGASIPPCLDAYPLPAMVAKDVMVIITKIIYLIKYK